MIQKIIMEDREDTMAIFLNSLNHNECCGVTTPTRVIRYDVYGNKSETII